MANKLGAKRLKRERRHRRVRARVQGTAERPRLCVYRSLKHIYAQLIDDTAGKTLVSAQDKDLGKEVKSGDQAKEVGKLLAAKASEKKIETVVFDRGGCRYHGRVKALAEGAREGGLKF